MTLFETDYSAAPVDARSAGLGNEFVSREPGAQVWVLGDGESGVEGPETVGDEGGPGAEELLAAPLGERGRGGV